MKIKKNKTLLFGIISLLLINFSSCDEPIEQPTWVKNINDIYGPAKEEMESIDIDVYIDATTSMEGFAVSELSNYSDFLDVLEARTISAWKKANPKYFKFGEKVKEIDRNGFLLAKSNRSFYHEQGIFMNTYIDSVIVRTDNNRLSVVITDLFQDGSDVNSMVEKIKEKCFMRNVSVGILGIYSGFEGRVFDIPQFPSGYSLTTDSRPFYALVFGNHNNMEKLFKSLSTCSYINDENFLIFSKYITDKFDVTVSKNKESKFGNKLASNEDYIFNFGWTNSEISTASFDVEIIHNSKKNCATYLESGLNMIVYKKEIINNDTIVPDSVLTKDITISGLSIVGDTLTASLKLINNGVRGNYSYLVYLKVDPLGGFMIPPWISEMSTDNPVPGSPSASLTYNLEKFTERLLTAYTTVSPTYIAKFYINIRKK